jgi:hypothetical protein
MVQEGLEEAWQTVVVFYSCIKAAGCNKNLEGDCAGGAGVEPSRSIPGSNHYYLLLQ